MLNKKFTAPQFVASLFTGKRGMHTPALMLSHPFININVSVMDELKAFLRLKFKRGFSSSMSWTVMENIALWLKKCLLMQRTTRKFGLQLLMATG